MSETNPESRGGGVNTGAEYIDTHTEDSVADPILTVGDATVGNKVYPVYGSAKENDIIGNIEGCVLPGMSDVA